MLKYQKHRSPRLYTGLVDFGVQAFSVAISGRWCRRGQMLPLPSCLFMWATIVLNEMLDG